MISCHTGSQLMCFGATRDDSIVQLGSRPQLVCCSVPNNCEQTYLKLRNSPDIILSVWMYFFIPVTDCNHNLWICIEMIFPKQVCYRLFSQIYVFDCALEGTSTICISWFVLYPIVCIIIRDDDIWASATLKIMIKLCKLIKCI